VSLRNASHIKRSERRRFELSLELEALRLSFPSIENYFRKTKRDYFGVFLKKQGMDTFKA
jgi:hypothetical protein